MPVAPRLRPDVTLDYKTRIKMWSNISFLLFLSHNSYVFKEKNTSNRHTLDWSHTVDGDLKIQTKLLYVAKTNA